MYTFSEDYIKKCAEKEDTGPTPVNPLQCGKETFRELIAYYIVKSTQNFQDYDEKIADLENRATELEAKVSSLEDDNSNLKESLDDVTEENVDLKSKYDQLSKDMKDRDDYVAGLTTEMDKMRKQYVALSKAVNHNHDKVLANERHTRGFCLRFNVKKVKERANEDTTAILTSEFQKVGLDDIKIENSHRVGKPRDDGKGRQIIARFHSRPERNLVLKKRKDLFKNDVQCFEDLCKEDLDEKRKYAELMQEKFDSGHKVFFSRGRWHVDGVVWNEPLLLPGIHVIT